MEKFDVTKIPALDTCFNICETDLQTGVVLQRKSQIENPLFYHKFTIHYVGHLTRNEALNIIVKHVLPNELVPIGYYRDRTYNRAYFFAESCYPVIEKLAKDNLIIANPHNPRQPLQITIMALYTYIAILAPLSRDINKSIHTVLYKCYDPVHCVLNLSAFHNNKDLVEYIPLLIPKILTYILKVSKSLHLLKGINLANNEIFTLDSLEVLWGATLDYLNLEDNNLTSADLLEPLKQMTIKKLDLGGNPFCANYQAFAYLKLVESYVPGLKVLDGVNGTKGFLSPTQNYLCNLDGCDMVDQLLMTFFPVYDSNNRQKLESMYHKDAMFSLTSAYLPGQSTSSTAQLKDYKFLSRNIMSLADYSKSNDNLFKGKSNIMRVFAKLPPTEHDLCSFDTDLIFLSDTCATLVIHGTYKETESERILGFSRNFVLQSNGDGAYLICNEQLHVYNALTTKHKKAFKLGKPNLDFPMPETPQDKQLLIEAVKRITTLNTKWAKYFLEEWHYKLEDTLKFFVETYKADKIPPEAFEKDDCTDKKEQHKAETEKTIGQAASSPLAIALSKLRKQISIKWPAENIEEPNPSGLVSANKDQDNQSTASTAGIKRKCIHSEQVQLPQEETFDVNSIY